MRNLLGVKDYKIHFYWARVSIFFTRIILVQVRMVYEAFIWVRESIGSAGSGVEGKEVKPLARLLGGAACDDSHFEPRPTDGGMETGDRGGEREEGRKEEKEKRESK